MPNKLKLLLFAFLVLSLSHTAPAGPMLPCMSSAMSSDGNILVTQVLTFDDPDETHARKITTSRYQVYRRYTDLNWTLRLNGPNTYWADPFWKVDFTPSMNFPIVACSYVLVPNSGEYLIFIRLNGAVSALTIYHHRPYDPVLGPLVSQQGELVREIKLSELWPSTSPFDIITDHTPQWFAGGVFNFSTDQKALELESQNGRRLRIDLATGAIEHVRG